MHNGAPMLSAYPTAENNFPNTGDVLAAGVTVHGDLTIAQATDAQTIRVHGDAVFDADMTLGHDGTDITAHGDLTVTSDVVFGNLNNVPPKTLTVHGDVTLQSRLFVNSDVSITGLTVSGSADFQSGVAVPAGDELLVVQAADGRLTCSAQALQHHGFEFSAAPA